MSEAYGGFAAAPISGTIRMVDDSNGVAMRQFMVHSNDIHNAWQLAGDEAVSFTVNGTATAVVDCILTDANKVRHRVRTTAIMEPKAITLSATDAKSGVTVLSVPRTIIVIGGFTIVN